MLAKKRAHRPVPSFRTVPRWPIVFLAFASASIAIASPTYSGTVNAVFTNEETDGFYLDANYNPVWYDDNDPVYSGDGTDSIVAGVPAPGSEPDQWEFLGASFSNVQEGQTFLLGQLEYFNGTDELGTDLFGGDLTLNFDLTDGTSVDPLTLQYQHISTVNIGNEIHDADWLNFSQINASFHVYENDWATANVYGRIIGDPYAGGLTLQILPDANGDFNGWIGPSEPVVPAPAAVAPFLLGVCGVLKRRRG